MVVSCAAVLLIGLLAPVVGLLFCSVNRVTGRYRRLLLAERAAGGCVGNIYIHIYIISVFLPLVTLFLQGTSGGTHRGFLIRIGLVCLCLIFFFFIIPKVLLYVPVLNNSPTNVPV